MIETEKCSWCGAEAVETVEPYVHFSCHSYHNRKTRMWFRHPLCEPPKPQPASDRQELIRRFAAAIVGGYFANKEAYESICLPDIWKMAVEMADWEPRVDGTEGTA